MKILHKTHILLLLIIYSTTSFSQLQQPFAARYSEDITGDFTMIANNMISQNASGNYNNGNFDNNDFTNNVYVDIDSDNTTFNSSKATFTNPAPSNSCLTVQKAFLYWAASDFEPSNGNENQPNWNFNQVKIQLPNQTSYTTITADQIIYRGRNTHFSNDPYICFKDITDLVNTNSSAFGEYQVANVEGKIGGLTDHQGIETGVSGGWQIGFIYTSPILPKKNVSIFDGYAHVTRNDNNFNVEFAGFLTPPTGQVDAKIIFGALEGDRNIGGDHLQILDTNGNYVGISTNLRGTNNFFNSRITANGANFLDRTPASRNTLGFDAAIFDLDNPNNSIIANNQTSTTIRMTSDQETYGLYMLGYSVEIFEPNLQPLLVTATPNSPNHNSNANIVIDFDVDNQGNDRAQDLAISVTIPNQFNLVGTTYPNGVSHTFDANGTRELAFAFDDSIIDINNGPLNISFELEVKNECYFLEDNCDLNPQIQLTANYRGVENPEQQTISSSSATDACGIGNAAPLEVVVNQPNMANWTTMPGDLDITLECDNVSGLSAAQALIPELDKCNFNIVKTSGDFIPEPACLTQGTYTNTFTYTDACGRNMANFTQIITIIDTTPPNIINNPNDLTVECDGNGNTTQLNDWLQANASATATDNCNTITWTNNYTSLTNDCGNTGSALVEFTASDSCGNQLSNTATFSIVDTTGPDLTNCTLNNATLNCDSINNETIANQWNADNITLLESCATDNCSSTVTITSNYQFSNLVTSCGNSGGITVIYTITDECNNSSTVWSTLTLQDTTAPSVVNCQLQNQSTVSIDCNSVNNETIASQWNADNIATLQSCATDSCDTAVSVTSNYDYNQNFTTSCGDSGSITVIYTLTDACNNASTITSTLILKDTIAPSVANCSLVDQTLDCSSVENSTLASQWNNDNITKLQACATDTCSGNVIVTSNYNFDNFNVSCGLSGTLEVIYTISDECGNSTSTKSLLTLEDTTPPNVTNCNVQDTLIECDSVNNKQISDDWNKANLEELQNCSIDSCSNNLTIESDYNFSNYSPTCGNSGNITTFYTITDQCGNTSTIRSILTIKDTTAPNITSCDIDRAVVIECQGGTNENLINKWNTDNITRLETCATDSCSNDISISSDFSLDNFINNCGSTGSISVNYTIEDACGNTEIILALLTIEDTTAPSISTCNLDDITINCSTESAKNILDNWNANNLQLLTNCANDSCSTNSTIVSDYNYSNVENGSLLVTYTIKDDCGNTSSLIETFITTDTSNILLKDIAICVNNPIEFKPLDLRKLLEGSTTKNGTWEITSNTGGSINGHILNPSSAELGEMTITYTEDNSACYFQEELTIEMHNRCGVLACVDQEIEVSKLVTPNGDGINDVFDIKGIKDCNFTVNLKIINRWGAIIYSNSDYKNNWAGESNGTTFGSATTLPNGTYYYIIELKNSGINPLTGPIYLGTR